MRQFKQFFVYFNFIFFVFLAIALACVILVAVNSRVKSHYEDLTAEKAFLLTRQVKKIITEDDFDVDSMGRRQKTLIRQILNKFCQDESDIRNIFLISSDNRIVVSSEAILEGQVYNDENEKKLLNVRQPIVAKRTTSAVEEVIDIVWPVLIDNEFRGHIRTVVRFDEIGSYNTMRYIILAISGAGLVLLLMFSLLLAWRRNKIPLNVAASPHSAKPEAVPESNGKPVEKTPEYKTVFSDLNRMYAQAEDLDTTFQQSEAKFHSMMRVLHQGLLIMDLNMKIISYNEYLLDVFHIRTPSSAERKVYDLLQKNPRIVEMYRRAKDPLTYEVKQIFFLNLLNGRKINIEVLARPFYNGNDITGVTFYFKNLEKLRDLEHTLQRSMKYGVISQLSSSIGHEIRNPLSSLAIHTEIVDSMVTKSVSDETRLSKIKKSIGILNSEVERLQKLIDQFFKLAKTQEVHLTYENLNDLMSEVIDLVYQQALESSINLEHDFGNDLPMVKVSRDQLKQVVINLILNGYDAMPGGGDVLLKTRFKEDKVIISVKDSGSGIPENVRGNVFDLYFTTKDTGGGIGLAICKKIIEAHDGKLFFKTKTGVGTIFYIELPTRQK